MIRRIRENPLMIVFVIVAAFTISAMGYATATAQTAPNTHYCVTFGHGASAAGNYVLYDWDQTPCPANTYPHTIPAADDTDNFLPSVFPVPPTGTAGVAWVIVDSSVPGVVTTYHCSFTSPTDTHTTDPKTGLELYAPNAVCVKA